MFRRHLCRGHGCLSSSSRGGIHIQHKPRAPVLPLLRLLVHPQHPLAQEVLDDGLGAGPGPAQVDHQHGDADVAEDLDGLEDGALVGAELLRHGADVGLVADADDGVAGAEGLEGADGAQDVVVGDLGGALHAAAHDLLAQLAHADQAAVVGARLAAHLDHAHRQLEVEVVDGAAQQLRPHTATSPRTAAAARRRGQRVHADGRAHARELGAEGRVRPDVLGVRLRELLQQRPEHGQLGAEGLGVAGPQRVAVRGELGRGQARAVEGREADAFAGHSSLLDSLFDSLFDSLLFLV